MSIIIAGNLTGKHKLARIARDGLVLALESGLNFPKLLACTCTTKHQNLIASLFRVPASTSKTGYPLRPVDASNAI
jgi:hypothetical protein